MNKIHRYTFFSFWFMLRFVQIFHEWLSSCTSLIPGSTVHGVHLWIIRFLFGFIFNLSNGCRLIPISGKPVVFVSVS
eukprot:UN00581